MFNKKQENVEIDYNFWDYLPWETIEYVRDVFEVGYTAPDYVTFEIVPE